jgi:AcrR family transcriptional regulator
MVQGDAGECVRERLLEAAGRVFAEKGYRAATVREICRAAGASVATINYHFGSKQKLYAEVLSSIFDYVMARYPHDLGQAEATTPEEKLVAFVRSFLLRRLDPDRPAWHRRLLRREMGEPSAAKRAVIRTVVRQSHALLRQILKEVMPRGSGREQIDLCIASIVGQCLYYHHGRHVMPPNLRAATRSPDGIDRLARHIARFSLTGLESDSTRPARPAGRQELATP